MAKINSFDRANLKAFRADLERTLKDLGTLYGIKIAAGAIRYNPTSARCTIEAKTLSVTGDGTPVIPEALRKQAALRNLKLVKNGYELTDYVPRRHKYPFTYKTPDGKAYRASLSNVLMMFSKD